MTRYLLCFAVMLALDGLAQVPAYQCDGPVCVGVAGQDVNLGGTVLETRGNYSDAGLAILRPLVSGATLTLEGVQGVGTPGSPDVIIRSRTAHDGGTILSVRNNQTEVFSVTAAGQNSTASTITTLTATTVKTTLLDAGSGIINGNLVIAGVAKVAVLDAGVAFFNGEVGIVGSTSVTTCTLGGQTPSTCTATVRGGSVCHCSLVGATAAIAAKGCAVGLSGTTLTVTSANSATDVVNIHCF